MLKAAGDVTKAHAYAIDAQRITHGCKCTIKEVERLKEAIISFEKKRKEFLVCNV